MYRTPVHFHRLGVELDHEIASSDGRFGMSFRATHDGMNARHQFIFVEWLGHVVISSEAKTSDLVFNPAQTGEDQYRRLNSVDSQRPQDLEARHIRQVQIEHDEVVIVQLAEVETLFPEISDVNVEAFGLEHQLNGPSSGNIVLNEQDTHVSASSQSELET